jgi:hypothetical protein
MLKGIVGVLLILFAVFCLFGFLHAFEPGTSAVWKIGYALLAFASMYGGYRAIRSSAK